MPTDEDEKTKLTFAYACTLVLLWALITHSCARTHAHAPARTHQRATAYSAVAASQSTVRACLIRINYDW